MYLLEVRGLTKHFGGIKAIEDASFKIKEGSIVSIIGPNGAGKTTLFNCLTGITRMTRGVAYFSGRTISGLPPYDIVRLGIARTFQNIRLFREMTVLDNILVSQHLKIKAGFIDAVMRGRGFLSEERTAREKALEYLDFVGLREQAPVPSLSLSYGDQRRLEIARALATDPALLLLDEPTAGMNPQETSETMKIILRLQKMGKTIVLIEHDMKVVMGISETVIVFDHGVKIAEGSPEVIKNEPMVIKAYLGR
ncbi:MAG: ABC transporter ATP-binding protein [Thermodesulfovibrionales bacterium]|jgi:branched-chain amino acid transport system ATP-binding protein